MSFPSRASDDRPPWLAATHHPNEVIRSSVCPCDEAERADHHRGAPGRVQVARQSVVVDDDHGAWSVPQDCVRRTALQPRAEPLEPPRADHDRGHPSLAGKLDDRVRHVDLVRNGESLGFEPDRSGLARLQPVRSEPRVDEALLRARAPPRCPPVPPASPGPPSESRSRRPGRAPRPPPPAPDASRTACLPREPPGARYPSRRKRSRRVRQPQSSTAQVSQGGAGRTADPVVARPFVTCQRLGPDRASACRRRRAEI